MCVVWGGGLFWGWEVGDFWKKKSRTWEIIDVICVCVYNKGPCCRYGVEDHTVKVHKITFQMSQRWTLYMHSLLKYSSLKVEIWKPQFSGKIVWSFPIEKTEKRTKIKDQEGEAGKIFLNRASANLLCTSSTLGLHGKPGINYQQLWSFFSIEISPSMYCHLYFFPLSRECAVNSDWHRNIVIT